MLYIERLTPWMLVRLLPNMQRLTVGNFRTRGDAEGHLQILCRLIPQAKYVVMFNPNMFKLPQADTHYRKQVSLTPPQPSPYQGEGVRLL